MNVIIHFWHVLQINPLNPTHFTFKIYFAITVVWCVEPCILICVVFCAICLSAFFITTVFVLCLLTLLYMFIFLHVDVRFCVSLCPHAHILFSFFILDPVCGLSVCTPPPLPNFFQVRTLASAGGPDNLVMLDPGKYKARPRVPEPAGDGSSTHPKWQVGEQEFEALMRMLDNLVSTNKKEATLRVCGEVKVYHHVSCLMVRHPLVDA